MKLNSNHITGLVRDEKIKRQLVQLQQKNTFSMGFGKEGMDHVEQTFLEVFESNVKSYLIKKTAQDVINRIRIGGSFDPKVFQKIPIQKAEIVLNEHQLYRYWFDGVVLRGIFVQKINTELGPEIKYDSFSIQPDTGRKSYNLYDDSRVKEIAEKLFKMIIFLYFSEIQEVILKPNAKSGSLSSERFKNELKQSFIIVDTTWNRISIRTEGFSVSAHFRLQPCGKNNEDRKLIFIDEFDKTGYVRGATKYKKAC